MLRPHLEWWFENPRTVEGTTGDYIVQRSFTKARRTPFNSS